MLSQVNCLYICPWSLNDPLCRSQSLAYLNELTNFGYKFAFITFENPAFQLELTKENAVKNELSEMGIFWYPVRYQKGDSIFNKFYESFSGIVTGISAIRRHRPRIIHTRSSLPIGIALTLSKLFRLKYLYDADSMLSEEYAETGHWSRDGFSYKTTVSLENTARRRADEIVVLTKKLRKDYIADPGVKAPIEVIPCCIDLQKFRFSESARNLRRAELGIEDAKLLIYVGKYGKRYLVEETFAFFKVFNQNLPSSRLLIVSRENKETFARIAERFGIAENLYFVRSGSQSEVSEWLSAADAGLCLIREMKSERGSSPIKFSEYLSIGLPVVITDSIGDCSALVASRNIGVVLPALNTKGYSYAVEKLLELYKNEERKIFANCRKAAEENFSLTEVAAKRYLEIYNRLLNK